MRLTFILLWALGLLCHFAAANSDLAHMYEAIYFYFGYKVDLAINGDQRTLGPNCIPRSGSICTLGEFMRSIQGDYDAAYFTPGPLGDTTSPDDLQVLAEDMLNWNYGGYKAVRLTSPAIRYHSGRLQKVTDILISARAQQSTALNGGLLVQAKSCLLYIQAEHEDDHLPNKVKALREAWENLPVQYRTVTLDEQLISFTDIDWEETAIAYAAQENAAQAKQDPTKPPKTVSDIEDGFRDWSRNPPPGDEEFLGHRAILISIRAQSDQLGSLVECRRV